MANFNEAIRLNQNDAVAYYDRGLTYSNKGDYDRAIADYNEAIRLDPKYALAFLTEASLIRVKATTTAPLPISTRPFDSIPCTLSPLTTGAIYEKKGDYDRAIADYNEAIDSIPGTLSPLSTGASLI